MTSGGPESILNSEKETVTENQVAEIQVSSDNQESTEEKQIPAQITEKFVKPKVEHVEAKEWQKVRKEKVFKTPIYVLPNDLIDDPEKDQNLVDYITKYENKLSYFDHPSIMVEGRITTSLKENIKINRQNKTSSAAGYYFFMQAKPDSPEINLENGRKTIA